MVSRSELATRLARHGASHAQAAHAVDAVLHEITAALAAGERVALTGFGTFEPVSRPERTARNPRTGAAVAVPAATVARFRAGTALRGALRSGAAGQPPAGSLPAPGPVGRNGEPEREAAVGLTEAVPVTDAVGDRSGEAPRTTKGGRDASDVPERGAKGKSKAAATSAAKSAPKGKEVPAKKRDGGKKDAAAKKHPGGTTASATPAKPKAKKHAGADGKKAKSKH